MLDKLNSTIKAYYVISVYLKRKKVTADSCQQFMDAFSNDLFDEDKECLFGEFISDEHPYEVQEDSVNSK